MCYFGSVDGGGKGIGAIRRALQFNTCHSSMVCSSGPRSDSSWRLSGSWPSYLRKASSASARAPLSVSISCACCAMMVSSSPSLLCFRFRERAAAWRFFSFRATSFASSGSGIVREDVTAVAFKPPPPCQQHLQRHMAQLLDLWADGQTDRRAGGEHFQRQNYSQIQASGR